MLYWNRIYANLEETGWISAGLLTEKVNAEREENDMKKTMTMLLACAITAGISGWMLRCRQDSDSGREGNCGGDNRSRDSGRNRIGKRNF